MVKRNTLQMFGILAILVLALGFASALENVTVSVNGAGESDSSRISGVNATTKTVQLKIVNNNIDYNETGSLLVNFSSIDLQITPQPGLKNVTKGDNPYNINFVLPSNVGNGNFNITAHFWNSSDESEGSKEVTVYYTSTLPPTTPVFNFCNFGEKGDLEISDFYIDNLGFGDDEEWEHLDRIELVVEVYNKDRDDRINDVILQIMIKDRNGNDVTKDFELDDEELELRRIRERDSVIAKFIIKELPIDIDEDLYKVYIKAYSKGDEENICVSSSSDFNGEDNLYHEIEVIREEDPAVYVRTSEVQRMSVVCGQENVEVTVPVYNFGSSREDRVLVTLTNSLLGISESQVISNLRSGRKTDITFLFDIPQNLDRNTYDLAVNTYFDVDDLDGDLYDIFNYDESSSSLGRTHVIRIEVTGCQRPSPSITATLDSVASTEEELVVKAIIRNNDAKDLTFAISATEFESWATLVSITPQVPLIRSGDTQEVIIRLMPTESGLRSFKISVTADGETYVQPVSVNITGEEEGKDSIIDGIDDVTLFLIIGIVALLILILIILIIRATRRSKKVAY